MMSATYRNLIETWVGIQLTPAALIDPPAPRKVGLFCYLRPASKRRQPRRAHPRVVELENRVSSAQLKLDMLALKIRRHHRSHI
jgi:hypothetical protein